MPSIYQFSEIEIITFSLVLLRMSAFIVSWPVFSGTSVPQPLKILMALVIALLVFPVLNTANINAEVLNQQLIWLAVREVFVGVVLGYLCRFFFFVISVAGQLISTSIGLANAQILNPALGTTGSPVEQFQVALATLFFLAINGHHLFLGGLVESFELVPLSVAGLNIQVFSQAGGMVQEIVVMGIKISAPVMVAIFFMNLAMGIVGRAVPQINVLITSLPVNILVGFLVMIVSVPLFIVEMGDLLNMMTERLFYVMKEL